MKILQYKILSSVLFSYNAHKIGHSLGASYSQVYRENSCSLNEKNELKETKAKKKSEKITGGDSIGKTVRMIGFQQIFSNEVVHDLFGVCIAGKSYKRSRLESATIQTTQNKQPMSWTAALQISCLVHSR